MGCVRLKVLKVEIHLSKATAVKETDQASLRSDQRVLQTEGSRRKLTG
jgi:hypothetical protein